MSEIIKNENNFVGYEYKNITVKRDMESVYIDGYLNFGWTLEGTSIPLQSIGSVTMKLKRNRKVNNKAEITRLQRQFEACVVEIETLERSKVIKASAVAYVIGVAGTAFMAGSVFAYIAGMLLPSIILAVPGFVGWIIPYLCYSSIHKNKTAEVTPFIDKKYDEIYEVCEKAHAILVD